MLSIDDSRELMAQSSVHGEFCMGSLLDVLVVGRATCSTAIAEKGMFIQYGVLSVSTRTAVGPSWQGRGATQRQGALCLFLPPFHLSYVL